MQVHGLSPGSVAFAAPLIPLKSAQASVAPKESLNTSFPAVEELIAIEPNRSRILPQTLYSLSSVGASAGGAARQVALPQATNVSSPGSVNSAVPVTVPGTSSSESTDADEEAAEAVAPDAPAVKGRDAEANRAQAEVVLPGDPQSRNRGEEGVGSESSDAGPEAKSNATNQPDPAASAPGRPADTSGLSEQELAQIKELAARDRDVRLHEQQHQSIGGRFAGAINLKTQRGPDGVQYAIGGEVSIDISEVPNNPSATIEKMRIVRAAALAPAEPSAQDRAVAAAATRIMLKAQVEAAKQTREDQNESEDKAGAIRSNQRAQAEEDKKSRTENQSRISDGIETYQQLIRLGRQFEQGLVPEINLDQLI